MSTQWAGSAFPWTGTIASLIEPKDDISILETSIQMILFTRKGERVMLRDFGSLLHEKVFDPNDRFLSNQIVNEIRTAVARWDDRIGIETIDVFQEGHEIKLQIVFYNAKDPLKTPRTFAVALSE